MADLTATLVAASRADRAAEDRLHEHVKSNYAEMVRALAVEIATEGQPVEARQMASLFLKNTLNAKSPQLQQELHDRWKQLPADGRRLVKDALLQALRSAEPVVPRFAAVAAAEIAAVELPYQEWPTFVGAMTDALSSPQTPESVKLASLECLGFTCERINEVQEMLPEVPELTDVTVNQMLTTIVQGVQPDRSDALRFAALQALAKSLSFVHKNMEVPAERDFIMKNAICGATQSADPKVRKLAFQCMDEVAGLYYEMLQDYMTDLFQLTAQAIQNDTEDEVKMAAIEFWYTIAYTETILLEEEAAYQDEGRALVRQPCKKYVESAMQPLVPLLLDTLSKHDDDTDEDFFDLRACGASCLDAMSRTVRSLIVPLVIPFVQQYITSDNWHFRDAAIVAFSSIMEGPTTTVLGAYVHQSILVLLTALGDPNEIVRDSAIFCISNICRLHMSAVEPTQAHSIIQGLIAKMQESPKMASRASSAIFHMSQSYKSLADIRPDTNLLSAPMLPLMQALLAATDRPDAAEHNLRVSAMAAAAELVSASARDVQHILRDLLPAINTRIEGALAMEVLSNDDRESKALILGLLSGLVTVLFQRLEKADLMPHADRCMEILLQMLQVPNANCHEEVFMAMGAIATAVDDDFSKYLTALMPFLITGLNSFQAQNLFTVCVGVVVDLCTAVGNQIQPYSDQIMGALTACLKDGTAHRETKPVVFSCFGDIAMAIGGAYEPYLAVSTMLLMQAAAAPISLDDEEMVDFINRLRLSVLDAYTGIVVGLSDGGKLNIFVPYVTNVMQFLQFLSTPESYKDDLCLSKAVGLIGDIGMQMGTDLSIRQQLQQHFVSSLVMEASASGSPETRDVALWAQDVVQQVASAQ